MGALAWPLSSLTRQVIRLGRECAMLSVSFALLWPRRRCHLVQDLLECAVDLLERLVDPSQCSQCRLCRHSGPPGASLQVVDTPARRPICVERCERLAHPPWFVQRPRLPEDAEPPSQPPPRSHPI